MIVRKCDFKNCEKAGICRCPKDRKLAEYWWFCQKHAAEYNKNWNYYAGMSAKEIDMEWEKDTFGDRGAESGLNNWKSIFGFINEQAAGGSKRRIPNNVMAAFATLGASPSDDWAKVQKKYRTLAKQEHPDTGKSKNQSRFVKISDAYQTLKKHFGK
jgi:hypothetical protein